jgi:glycosyltransferase involved in cell wall biosynthesis
MKISIIIPSFNQATFLQEALESIFVQNGVEREVLVFDGGSTDQTLEVLRRHNTRLAYWESRPDGGQTQAINKGLARMSGDVWMYLNSDDLLVPGALATVSRAFLDPSVMWVAGLCETFDESGTIGAVQPGAATRMKDYLAPWNRPSRYIFPFSGACYMRREVIDRIGILDESYQYSMDIEYYCRSVFAGVNIRQTIIPEVLAQWRWHPESKTMNRGIAYAFRAEEVRMAQTYGYLLSAEERAELDGEIRFQLKCLPAREAMWLLSEGRREDAVSLMLRAVGASPSLILFRPWLGAMRRAILGSHTFT